MVIQLFSVELQEKSGNDVAFYFVHWFADLAGAEASPLTGCEKFVLKFPLHLWLKNLRSWNYLQWFQYVSIGDVLKHFKLTGVKLRPVPKKDSMGSSLGMTSWLGLFLIALACCLSLTNFDLEHVGTYLRHVLSSFIDSFQVVWKLGPRTETEAGGNVKHCSAVSQISEQRQPQDSRWFKMQEVMERNQNYWPMGLSLIAPGIHTLNIPMSCEQ